MSVNRNQLSGTGISEAHAEELLDQLDNVLDGVQDPPSFTPRPRVMEADMHYYVSAQLGNDAASGSAAEPIRTLEELESRMSNLIVRDNTVVIHLEGQFTLSRSVYLRALFRGGGNVLLHGGLNNVVEILAEQTPTSSSTSSLTVSGAGWTVDQYRGYMAEFTEGSLEGKRYMVMSNTADTIQLNIVKSAIDTENAGAGPKFRIIRPSTSITGSALYLNGEGFAGLGANASMILTCIHFGTTQLRPRGGASSIISAVTYESTSSFAIGPIDSARVIIGETVPSEDGEVSFDIHGYCGIGYVGSGSGNQGRMKVLNCNYLQLGMSVIPSLETSESVAGNDFANVQGLRIFGTRILRNANIREVPSAAIGDISGFSAASRCGWLDIAYSKVEIQPLIIDGATGAIDPLTIRENSIVNARGVISGTNSVDAGQLGMRVLDASQLHLYATPTLTGNSQGAGFRGSATEADTYTNLDDNNTTTVNDGVNGDYSMIIGHVA